MAFVLPEIIGLGEAIFGATEAVEAAEGITAATEATEAVEAAETAETAAAQETNIIGKSTENILNNVKKISEYKQNLISQSEFQGEKFGSKYGLGKLGKLAGGFGALKTAEYGEEKIKDKIKDLFESKKEIKNKKKENITKLINIDEKKQNPTFSNLPEFQQSTLPEFQ